MKRNQIIRIRDFINHDLIPCMNMMLPVLYLTIMLSDKNHRDIVGIFFTMVGTVFLYHVSCLLGEILKCIVSLVARAILIVLEIIERIHIGTGRNKNTEYQKGNQYKEQGCQDGKNWNQNKCHGGQAESDDLRRARKIFGMYGVVYKEALRARRKELMKLKCIFHIIMTIYLCIPLG